MVGSQLLSKFAVPDLYSLPRERNHLHQLFLRAVGLQFVYSSVLIAAPAWSIPVELRSPTSIPNSTKPSFIESSVSVDQPLIPVEKKLPASTINLFLESTFPDSELLGAKKVFTSTASSKAAFQSTPYSRKAIDLADPSVAPENSSPLFGNNQSWFESAVPFAPDQPTPQVDAPELLIPQRIKRATGLIQIKSLDAGLLNSTATAPASVAQDPGTPTPPPVPSECSDPDLGCLPLQEPLPLFSTTRAPILYLVPRMDFFRSNNILLGVDPIDDGLIRPSLSLLALPPLGPNTYLIASVEGAFNRYFEADIFNYSELRIRAGIFQRLSSTMSAEIGWTNQQLFISSDKIPTFPAGTRFLNDHAIRFELSRRDQFTKRLFLSSFYQFRAGFSQPADRSRILNVLFLSLNYDLTSKLQFGLDYQFAAANFTIAPRTDIYHQVLGRVTLNAFRNAQLSVYGGLSLGDSTEPGINFNSYILGVTMTVNLVLF